MGNHHLCGSRSDWAGYSYFLPPEKDEELNKIEDVKPQESKKALNVNGQIIKPHLITDQLFVSGKLMPDEEVDLWFEAGKIIDVLNFLPKVSRKKDSCWPR